MRAYFPGENYDGQNLKGVTEANAYMTVPLVTLTVLIVVLGCFPGALTEFIRGTLLTAFPGL